MAATQEIAPIPKAAGEESSKLPVENIILQTINRTDENDQIDRGIPISTPPEEQERWNHPKGNIGRFFTTCLSFFILGMGDASLGALVPYLEQYYMLSYTVVSLLFLAPAAGYTLAALLNNSFHQYLGQRGIAIIAPFCHIITFLTLSLHPPFPVIVVFYLIGGFGNGLIDAAWCAWTGAMANANTIQGFLQAFYSLGATLSPLIATTMITKGHLKWYYWYYVMTSLAVMELLTGLLAFWSKTGAKYRSESSLIQGETGKGTREAIKNRITWMCALYFLAYVGAEVALGGWIVSFMLQVRKADAYTSGLSATGFWGGMTVGRAILGFVTERFGERLSVTLYLSACIGLELIFWLVPNTVTSIVAAVLLGFFLGPLFPAGIVMCTKLLPRSLHVAAIGFATARGGTGGAVLPFVVGAIASLKGVKVLQPIILALLVVISLLWLSLPRVKSQQVQTSGLKERFMALLGIKD